MRFHPRSHTVEELPQARAEVSQVILVGGVEHAGLQSRSERRESLAVDEPSEQDGVIRALNLCGRGYAPVTPRCTVARDGSTSARQRRFADHRRHMVRSATVALSTITNRIWTPVLFITLQPLQDSLFGDNEEHYLWFVAGLGGWLGWTIPLATVQWWLTHKPLAPPSSISQSELTSPR